MSAGRIIAQGTPAELVRAHAGEQVLEVYGPPERLARGRASWRRATAGRAGAAARRSRSCAPRRSTALAPEGVRRPANLEDAFVALTGEEIE